MISSIVPSEGVLAINLPERQSKVVPKPAVARFPTEPLGRPKVSGPWETCGRSSAGSGDPRRGPSNGGIEDLDSPDRRHRKPFGQPDARTQGMRIQRYLATEPSAECLRKLPRENAPFVAK